jgi:hypothetical protein
MSTLFRRYSEDKKFWWHWRDECNIVKTFSTLKKRGKTFVYLELESGKPTTFHLCPGCLAIDARYHTRAHPHAHPALTREKVIRNKIVVVPVRTTITAISKSMVSYTAALGFGQLPGTVRLT